MASKDEPNFTSSSQKALSLNPLPQVESQFSSLIFDFSQQVQGAMEDLWKMISEIEVQSADVTEEMDKCKEIANERRKAIEEEKECFQNAAFAVLNVLSSEDGKQNDQMLLGDGHEY